ncbi:type II toxin-antitoxin system PrlF family antitoxin [Bordetella holmesii]|uniref:Toxin-antitoxin system, antitoxin component, AbrB family n=2 Tax=Bordetella holmesii TaxID=35814 RepID=A0A158M8Q9_9BORD|nr:type II toxin-antitoxin system PrlF family antitoxin [Bordetella holmesii]AHV93845.1 htrA suppressor protein [Bordetella holmesii ATCC 51541]AIT27106.1 htrA suppressor protein [Bordetella holmesii 44057]EWM42897.1 htrA suppressor protein [Bordetella holmesii 41130]EWM47690.1 htrA suppressor protein [Bordetella holmesii 35009]EWM51859.1 htrA suppressor protein [Bordetella holmesii 70147]
MSATLEAQSTLTDRYQTTVPETVRRALRLGKRDKIHYSIRPSGEVVLTRAEMSEGDDPVLGQFLSFLARDIASHPERLQSVDAALVQRLQSLVGGVEVDLDAVLSAGDE